MPHIRLGSRWRRFQGSELELRLGPSGAGALSSSPSGSDAVSFLVFTHGRCQEPRAYPAGWPPGPAAESARRSAVTWMWRALGGQPCRGAGPTEVFCPRPCPLGGGGHTGGAEPGVGLQPRAGSCVFSVERAVLRPLVLGSERGSQCRVSGSRAREGLSWALPSPPETPGTHPGSPAPLAGFWVAPGVAPGGEAWGGSREASGRGALPWPCRPPAAALP